MSATSWPPAAKDLIGTACGAGSRVWFSCAHGILTEVFYPAPDQVALRSFELAIVDGDGRIFEEAANTVHAVTVTDPEVPFARFVNRSERFQIDKEVLADPIADVILVRVRLTGDAVGRLFCFADPHLGDRGDATTARVGTHKGAPILFAERADGLAFALACSAPIFDATAAFAGDGDGRAQLREHGKLVERSTSVKDGTVTLAAELDHRAVRGEVTFALAFARLPAEAAHAALSSLHRGFDWAHARYVSDWKNWHAALSTPPASTPRPLWTVSATILKTLEASPSTGGRVAALATPWGPSRGPGLAGTYHLVWTRDLVQSVSGLLAAGGSDEVRRAMAYLQATQDAAGHWPQNMRITGEHVWNDDELDEVALPLVFVARVARAGLASETELAATWPMVARAANWIMQHGPATPRDRWEDTSGVTPFSLAAAIVALLSAAELADQLGHRDQIAPLVARADDWHGSIDAFLYRRGGALADKLGIAGYYVRSHQLGEPFLDLDLSRLPPTELSPDALALVRFGLRAADDPRIVDTVRAIDAVLRSDLPSGPAWRRYPGDQYGEHADGSAFDHRSPRGIGRPWPLLVGERAHYELARGRLDEATALAATLEGCASSTGNLSEQVWDQPDLPARGLVRGKPTHSASPLGWAHGEYLTLCRSLSAGRVFDLPSVSYDRYLAPRAAPRR
jgi:glucoamylase